MQGYLGLFRFARAVYQRLRGLPTQVAFLEGPMLEK